MMKEKQPLLVVASFTLIVLFASCTKDEDPLTITLTQSNLDAVSVYIGSYTGGQMAHGGPAGTSPDSTVREVNASHSFGGSIPAGTIITKKTYKRGTDGQPTDELFVSFAMVKRESGYFPDGGDWEYVMMPYSASTDYSAHPYGVLPEAESDMRGKLNSCASCHSAASGGDFIFVN